MKKINKKSLWNKKNAFDKSKGSTLPPSYPNEMLVKVFSSKAYSNLTSCLFNKKIRVGELGCFSGNNLRFFIEKKYHTFGIEINNKMLKLCKNNLKRLNYKIPELKIGSNTLLPFNDFFFDAFVSINTIQYSFKEDIDKSLNEFSRVLAKGGIAIIETAGSKHFAVKRAKRNGVNDWKWQGIDFRDGQTFGFFDNKNSFKKKLLKYFSKVEVFERTENTNVKLNFYFAICKK